MTDTAAPGCPVLHDDPNNPIHPPWALEDVYARLRRVDRELQDLALGTIGTTARDRLLHKAQGVRLALSYVEDATVPAADKRRVRHQPEHEAARTSGTIR